jgi:hypothetical protein
MKRNNKLIVGGITLLLGATLLTGCTASFCSNQDKTHMLYVFDYGVTEYISGADAQTILSEDPYNKHAYKLLCQIYRDRHHEYKLNSTIRRYGKTADVNGR